jgi:hypothetical protein
MTLAELKQQLRDAEYTRDKGWSSWRDKQISKATWHREWQMEVDRIQREINKIQAPIKKTR